MTRKTEPTGDHRTVAPANTRRGSGTCCLCRRQIAHPNQAERHLWAGMPQWEAYTPPEAADHALYAHVNVRSDQYHWMELAVHHDTTLRDLDRFLRDTWLGDERLSPSFLPMQEIVQLLSELTLKHPRATADVSGTERYRRGRLLCHNLECPGRTLHIGEPFGILRAWIRSS